MYKVIVKNIHKRTKNNLMNESKNKTKIKILLNVY